MQALLEMDHIPTGMELFPASSEGVWETIKGVLAECDYYIVIVAGMYGSVDAQGISYTEREYDYAMKLGIPAIAFVHEDPGKLAAEQVEASARKKKSLAEFREKLKQSVVKHWNSAEELPGYVVTSMLKLSKSHPRTGWIRADEPSADVAEEVSRLRGEVLRLQDELSEARETLGPDWTGLASGTMPHEYRAFIRKRDPLSGRLVEEHFTVRTTWDEIVKTLGPLLYEEASESKLTARLTTLANELLQQSEEPAAPGGQLLVHGDELQPIKTQLLVLSLIEISSKPHGVRDTETYWTLTKTGRSHLLELSAIRSDGNPVSTSGAFADLAPDGNEAE